MKVESWKLQPCDRRYKSKGKKREQHMEILGGGICYCLTTSCKVGVIIDEQKEESMQ